MEEANPSSELDIPINIYETQALIEKAVTLPLPSWLLPAILLSSFSSHSDGSQLSSTTRSLLSCLSSISIHSFKSYSLSPRSLVFCFSSHPLCKAALWGQRHMEHRGRDRELGKQPFFCYTWLHLFLSTHTLLSPIVSLEQTTLLCLLQLSPRFSASFDTSQARMTLCWQTNASLLCGSQKLAVCVLSLPEGQRNHSISAPSWQPRVYFSLWEHVREGPEQATIDWNSVHNVKCGRQIYFTSFITGDCELVWTLSSP